jgi:hypothetical protein
MSKKWRLFGAFRATVAASVLLAALGFQASPASAAATAVTLDQAPGVTKAGQPHTVVATVRDEAGSLVPDGTRVTFSVVGTDGTVGRQIAVGPSFRAMAAHGTGGYWLADEAGDVLALGDAPALGGLRPADFPGWIIGMAATASGNGYWLASHAGVVYGFGDAGSEAVDFRPQLASGDWVAGIAPASAGFRVVTGKGFVFGGGGAGSPGSWASRTGAPAPADQPVLGIAATPSGAGFWLYDGRGKIVNLGNAPFKGEVSGIRLNHPIVGMSSSPTAQGYHLVAGDGGIFAFGDANFQGSTGGRDIPADIAGVVAQPDGAGYWIYDAEGRVYPFPASGGAGLVRGYGSTYTGLTEDGQAGFVFTSLTPGTTTVKVYAGDVATGPVLGSAGQEWSPADGYWMLGADGRVFPFGAAANLGQPDLGGAEAVDLEPTPAFGGYWIVDDTGAVFGYGDAGYFGGAERSVMVRGEKVTSLSATPSGQGYWIFTTRGRVFARGDATSLGDMAATPLNGPVLDSIATPTGQGYYMVASDGGIFAFGDAAFRGSMGDKKLNAPVQSLVPDGDGRGYWLVASDGGIFAFGAAFWGSMGDTKLNRPVTGMVAFGDGYLMVATDGGIFNFSDRPFYGSLGADPPARPIVSVAGLDPF